MCPGMAVVTVLFCLTRYPFLEGIWLETTVFTRGFAGPSLGGSGRPVASVPGPVCSPRGRSKWGSILAKKRGGFRLLGPARDENPYACLVWLAFWAGDSSCVRGTGGWVPLCHGDPSSHLRFCCRSRPPRTSSPAPRRAVRGNGYWPLGTVEVATGSQSAQPTHCDLTQTPPVFSS